MKIDHGTVLMYRVRERAVRVVFFIIHIWVRSLFCRLNDSRCDGFLTFSDTSRGSFSVASSVSHDQHLPVNLSRSFSRPIDRSYRIDHLSFFLFFSFARSLRFFNRLFSTSLSLALFSTFLLALSFAQKLSIEQQEICVRHDRILQLSFFCSTFVLLVTFFPIVTEPNTTARSSNQRIFQLLCMRFVYSSSDDYRVVSSASTPSTSLTLHSDSHQRGSSLFLFNKTDFRDASTNSADLQQALKIRQFNMTVLNPRWQAILMRLSFYSLWVLRRSPRRKNRQQFCHPVSEIHDMLDLKIWEKCLWIAKFLLENLRNFMKLSRIEFHWCSKSTSRKKVRLSSFNWAIKVAIRRPAWSNGRYYRTGKNPKE